MTTGALESEFHRRGWEVPAFRTSEFAARSARYCLVIPVINEGERIRRQLTELQNGGFADLLDIVIVDGGSTDGSLDEDFLAANGVNTLLTKTGPGKLSSQLRCAYAYALVRGYDGIITIDGNGKDSVDSLPKFVAALDAGIDYAQASRFIRGGEGVNTPLSRMLAIRLLHAPILSLAGRRWYTDTTQGYRAYSARYLLDERVKPFRDVFSGYELLAYLTARAGQLGYSIMEIPTRRMYPVNETTPTKISGLAAHFDLVAVLWNTLKGGYAPGPISDDQ